MEQIKLMVVEDNAELRRMITDYFEIKEDVEVVGTASNGAEALGQLEKAGTRRHAAGHDHAADGRV